MTDRQTATDKNGEQRSGTGDRQKLAHERARAYGEGDVIETAAVCACVCARARACVFNSHAQTPSPPFYSLAVGTNTKEYLVNLPRKRA